MVVHQMQPGFFLEKYFCDVAIGGYDSPKERSLMGLGAFGKCFYERFECALWCQAVLFGGCGHESIIGDAYHYQDEVRGDLGRIGEADGYTSPF